MNKPNYRRPNQSLRDNVASAPLPELIPKELWTEFENGPVTLSAISFKKHHPRTGTYGGNLCFYMQRMKVPPVIESQE